MTAYNGKINDWLIYNGVNQYIFDDRRNIVAPEKRIETDSKVFEYCSRMPRQCTYKLKGGQ
jgi:hypothetical protein